MSHPWRAVVGDPELRGGRGSVLGPDTSRRTRWWSGELECGHRFERTVRYKPNGWGRSGGWRSRSPLDVLPPPKRVRCDACEEKP